MFSFSNLKGIFMTRLYAVYYSLISILGCGIALKTEMPKTPEDFKPVVRFAVCSDIQLSYAPSPESERFAQLIDFMNAYPNDKEYKGFDALVVVGDLCFAEQFQYNILKDIIDSRLNKEKTQLIVCTGNHEYDAFTEEYGLEGRYKAGNEKFQEVFGMLNTSTVINGYHFIAASYSNNDKSYKDILPWFDSEIKTAVADTGEKPVFVFQHSGERNTVYGTKVSSSDEIGAVLKKYPQVVDFSAHSHYPINDPRSIWQANYTALTCGTLSYMTTQLDSDNDHQSYNSKKYSGDAAQFYIVEADASGNVRILPYDLITNQFFPNEYYLTNLADKNYEYSFDKMKRRDNRPNFPSDVKIDDFLYVEGETSITYDTDKYVCEENDNLPKNGDTILTFGGAKDRFIVDTYRVSLMQGIKLKNEYSFTSTFLYLNKPDEYTINLGRLESGKKYSVSILAVNAYGKASVPLNYTFIAK